MVAGTIRNFLDDDAVGKFFRGFFCSGSCRGSRSSGTSTASRGSHVAATTGHVRRGSVEAGLVFGSCWCLIPAI